MIREIRQGIAVRERIEVRVTRLYFSGIQIDLDVVIVLPPN